ncbi:hypothetical protein MTO96_037333 [Rhipicephalus appendiculatus]
MADRVADYSRAHSLNAVTTPPPATAADPALASIENRLDALVRRLDDFVPAHRRTSSRFQIHSRSSTPPTLSGTSANPRAAGRLTIDRFLVECLSTAKAGALLPLNVHSSVTSPATANSTYIDTTQRPVLFERKDFARAAARSTSTVTTATPVAPLKPCRTHATGSGHGSIGRAMYSFMLPYVLQIIRRMEVGPTTMEGEEQSSVEIATAMDMPPSRARKPDAPAATDAPA